ncbi:MAG: AbrB family transcriptional regulator [Geminicoccaceae bacterium]
MSLASRWEAARRVLAAVVIGAAGGILFHAVHLPLPWMMGAMVATTVASMAGVPQTMPAWARPPTIAVLGVLLGSSFTREMVGGMLEWLPSLLSLPVYILVIGLLALAYLRKVGRIDPLTAFFCATPGGLGEMVILGDRAGGDLRTISLVQATRILLVVLTVPMAFRLLGYLPPGGAPALALEIELLDLAVLVACGAAGLLAGVLLRLPAPGLLGPMLLSAAAHLLGLVEGSPPAALVAAAQIVIGSTVGVRFEGYPVVRVVWTMLVGLGLTILMLSVTVLFGLLLQLVTGMPLPLLVLALVPGGLAEMSLIALSLTDDPAFVATNHIVRLGLVVLFASALFDVYRRRLALPPSS